MTTRQQVTYFEIELDGKFEPRAARHFYFQATMIRATPLICHLLEDICGSLLEQIDPVKLEALRTSPYQLSKKSITLRFEITDEPEPRISIYDHAIIVRIPAYREDQSCLVSEGDTVEYLLDVIEQGANILSLELGGDFSGLTRASRKFAESGWLFRKQLRTHDRKDGTERWLEVDMHTYRIQIEKRDADGVQKVCEYFDMGWANYDDILETVKGLRKVKQGSASLQEFLSAYSHHSAEPAKNELRVYSY